MKTKHLLIILVFLTGCTLLDPEGLFLEHPDVQAFLEQHPDAEVSVVHLTADESLGDAALYKTVCGKQLPAQGKELYRAKIIDAASGLKLGAYIDAQEQRLECVRKMGPAQSTQISHLDPGTVYGEELTGLTLEQTWDCSDLPTAIGRRAECYNLSVSCEGIPARTVIVMQHQTPSATPRGHVVLSTGGTSRGFYTGPANDPNEPADVDYTYAKETVPYLLDNGYHTYMTSFAGDVGIGTYAGGSGITATHCAYALVAKWVSKAFASGGPICATGNSQGSMVISYGLARHGLENYLKAVVLSSGPWVRWDWGCFANLTNTSPYEDVQFHEGMLGQKWVDYLNGWTQSLDDTNGPCQLHINQGIVPNESVIATVASSKNNLVPEPDDGSMLLSYPRTDVSFVWALHDAAKHQNQGKVFYDAISAKSKWYYHVDDPADWEIHLIYNTQDGAQKIRERLLATC